MSRDRRYLMVVALGAVCWAIANAVNDWLIFGGTEGGWFEYAPNSAVAYSPDSSWILRELAVWLVAITVWFVVSRRLLRHEGTTN